MTIQLNCSDQSPELIFNQIQENMEYLTERAEKLSSEPERETYKCYVRETAKKIDLMLFLMVAHNVDDKLIKYEMGTSLVLLHMSAEQFLKDSSGYIEAKMEGLSTVKKLDIKAEKAIADFSVFDPAPRPLKTISNLNE